MPLDSLLVDADASVDAPSSDRAALLLLPSKKPGGSAADGSMRELAATAAGLAAASIPPGDGAAGARYSTLQCIC
jgi:hypothetical protein